MEKTLDHETSLSVIKEMVEKTRKDLSEGSFFYLLWGWLALGAAATEYALMVWAEVPWHPLVWAVMGITGGIASGIYGRKTGRRKGYRTFIDSSMKYVWIAFGAMMFLTLTVGATVSWSLAYALIIALYGMGTFISGGLLRFRPLIYGGIACWVITAAALMSGDFLLEFPTMLVLLMVSLVISYLIPGYALKNAENAQNAA